MLAIFNEIRLSAWSNQKDSHYTLALGMLPKTKLSEVVMLLTSPVQRVNKTIVFDRFLYTKFVIDKGFIIHIVNSDLFFVSLLQFQRS